MIRTYMYQGADHEIFFNGRNRLFGGAEKVFIGVGMDQIQRNGSTNSKSPNQLSGHRAEVALWAEMDLLK